MDFFESNTDDTRERTPEANSLGSAVSSLGSVVSSLGSVVSSVGSDGSSLGSEGGSLGHSILPPIYSLDVGNPTPLVPSWGHNSFKAPIVAYYDPYSMAVGASAVQSFHTPTSLGTWTPQLEHDWGQAYEFQQQFDIVTGTDTQTLPTSHPALPDRIIEGSVLDPANYLEAPVSSHSGFLPPIPATQDAPRPPRRRFKCDQCLNSFSNMKDLSRHRWTTHRMSVFTCKFCDQTLPPRMDNFRRHQRHCRSRVPGRVSDTPIQPTPEPGLRLEALKSLDLDSGYSGSSTRSSMLLSASDAGSIFNFKHEEIPEEDPSNTSPEDDRHGTSGLPGLPSISEAENTASQYREPYNAHTPWTKGIWPYQHHSLEPLDLDIGYGGSSDILVDPSLLVNTDPEDHSYGTSGIPGLTSISEAKNGASQYKESHNAHTPWTKRTRPHRHHQSEDSGGNRITESADNLIPLPSAHDSDSSDATRGSDSSESPIKATPFESTPGSESESEIADASFDDFDERKQQTICRVIKAVAAWLRSKFQHSHLLDRTERPTGNRSTQGTNHSNGSPPSEIQSDSRERRVPGPISKEGGRSNKRKASEGQDGEEEEDGEDWPSPRLNNGKGKAAESVKFACPYYKYNKAKYKGWRSCPGPGWPDIHRVKEHLYRKHRQPKYRCARCWESFGDEQTHMEHQRNVKPCPLKPTEPIDGFDAGQEARLRSRKKAKPELCEVEKWKAVFRILFPHVDDSSIPSPFYEHEEESTQTSLSDYQEYILKEVPLRLRRILAPELDRDLEIVEEGLKRKAIDSIKPLLIEVFREFRQLGQTTEAGGSSSRVPAMKPQAGTQTEHQDDIAREESNIAAQAIVEPPSHGQDSHEPDPLDLEIGNEEFDLTGLDLDFLSNPEYLLGEGPILEDLLQPLQADHHSGLALGGERKLSDSGYESNSNTSDLTGGGSSEE